MTTPSPDFTINGGAVGVKASVAAGGAVQCVIDDTSGVMTVTWSIIRTDDTTAASEWETTFSQSGSVGQQLDFTALTAGTACIVQAQINSGNILGEPSSESRATGKVFVPTAEGLEVGTDDELATTSLESNATHGAIEWINALVRAGGGSLGDWKPSARLSNHDVVGGALPAYTRTGSVLEANSNGALPNVDSVAPAVGDIIQHTRGTDNVSPDGADNGAYVIDDLGSAGSKWQMTRVLWMDESSELTSAARVPIEEGTDNGGKVIACTTTGDITINTTATTWTVVGGSLVVGPGASADHAIARWDGVTGKLLQSSTVALGDVGDMWIPAGGNLSLGAVPAVAGDVRTSDVFDLHAWGPAGDIGVLHKDAADNVTVGGAPNRPANLSIDPTGDTAIYRAGVSQLLIGNGLITAASPIAVNAGTVSAVGDIRGPDTLSITATDGAGTTDYGLLSKDASDVVTLGGEGGGATLPNAIHLKATNGTTVYVTGTPRLYIGNSIQVIETPLEFAKEIVLPIFRQEEDSGVASVGDLMTITAQECDGTGATVGGALLVQGGDATGGDTNTGGALYLRPGEHGAGGGTGGVMQLMTSAGVAQLQIDDDAVVKVTNAISIGSTVSALGDIRGDDTFSITATDGAGTTDYGLLYKDASDNLWVGGTQGATVTTPASIQLDASLLQMRIGTTAVTLQHTSGYLNLAVPSLYFTEPVATPVIDQALRASGTGEIFTIHAQPVTTGTGGKLALAGGTGSVAGGVVALQTAAGVDVVTVGDADFSAVCTGNAVMSGASSAKLQYNGTDMIGAISLGVFMYNNNLTWEASKTPAVGQQDDTVGTTGKLFTLQAQSLITATGTKTAGKLALVGGDCAGGTSNTGGGVDVHGGTGATEGGSVNIRGGFGGGTEGSVIIENGSDTQIEVDGTGLAFYGGTPVAQASDPGAMTLTTHGGQPNTILVDVSGSGDDATINDNFHELGLQLNNIRNILSATAGGCGLAA